MNTLTTPGVRLSVGMEPHWDNIARRGHSDGSGPAGRQVGVNSPCSLTRLSFSSSGLYSKGGEQRMAATSSGGTARKPVYVNASARLGRDYSGYHKCRTVLARTPIDPLNAGWLGVTAGETALVFNQKKRATHARFWVPKHSETGEEPCSEGNAHDGQSCVTSGRDRNYLSAWCNVSTARPPRIDLARLGSSPSALTNLPVANPGCPRSSARQARPLNSADRQSTLGGWVGSVRELITGSITPRLVPIRSFNFPPSRSCRLRNVHADCFGEQT